MSEADHSSAYPGLLVTFEGVEGSGKSTQVARLRDYLASQGRAVEVTREPGGTPIGEAIREILLDPRNEDMTATTELLLYEAARAQHVAQRIRPALESGRIVLCDRFADSTTAYQGAGRVLAPQLVRRLHEVATNGVWPDLTVLVDVPSEVGLARVTQGGAFDRLEREGLSFHQRVRAGFLRLAQEEPARVKVVDGTRPIDEVAGAIRALVDALLSQR